MRTEAAGLSPFPVRGAGAGPGAGPGSARLSSGGSRTARTPVSASARGGARPALGDALPSAPARCVTAQGTVLLPPRLSLLFSFPFSLEGARRRGGSARACPGGSAVSGAPVAQAGRCHSPRGKRRGDLIARHGLFPLRSPSPLRCWSTPGSSDVIWAEPAGMVPARVWAPRAPSLGSARLWDPSPSCSSKESSVGLGQPACSAAFVFSFGRHKFWRGLGGEAVGTL